MTSQLKFRAIVWILMVSTLAAQKAQTGETDLSVEAAPSAGEPRPLPATIGDLPTDVMRIIYRFQEAKTYGQIAQVSRQWNEDLLSSHEYPIHRSFHQLLHSDFASQGSIYEQLRFLEKTREFLQNLRPRLLASGRSDSLIRSLSSTLEERQLHLAQSSYRGDYNLLSPLLILAQSPHLSRQGQEAIYELSTQVNLNHRDRLWLALAINPSLAPELWEKLEVRVMPELLPLHWSGYVHQEITYRLHHHPSIPWSRQKQMFDELSQFVFFPVRVACICDWARQANLSPEIQQKLFESQLPELLALPRELSSTFLSRLTQALAKNPSLRDHHREALAQLVLQGGILPSEDQENLITAFATTANSEGFQERIWNEAVQKRNPAIKYQILLNFTENPNLTPVIRKVFQEMIAKLPASDQNHIRLKMAESPRLQEEIVAWLMEMVKSLKLSQKEPDDSTLEVVDALVKNPWISKKAVNFLVEWSQNVEDPAFQRRWSRFLLLQGNLDEQALGTLKSYSDRQIKSDGQANPLYSPEWFEFRRILFRYLPRLS